MAPLVKFVTDIFIKGW